MNKITWCTVIMSLVMGLSSTRVLAQDLDKEIQRPQHAAEDQDRAAEAAEEADQARATEGDGKITFEQVMSDPDDIDLNYRYAKQQIDSGELKAAAATLERILMVDPALPKVRLLYAIVLYRLDILPEARKELNDLKKLPMPDSLRAEIDEYLARISSKQRKLNLSTRFGLGFQYDTNRNAAPQDGRVMFNDVEIPLASGLKEDDQTIIGMARIKADYDLGMQAGHELMADFNYYRAEQTELDLIDFTAFAWSGGVKFKTVHGDFTPRAVFTYAKLDNEPYLRVRGADINFERKINRTVDVFVGGRSTFQEFIDGPAAPTAWMRTGNQTEFRFGANFVLNPKMRLTTSFQHTDKDAKRRWNAYTRESLRGSHAWLLGNGRFLLTSLTINFDRYDRPDYVISAKERSDNTMRLGAIFGTPLGEAGLLKDVLWTFNYEIFYSNSNLINYDYYNNKLNMMFTYKWSH